MFASCQRGAEGALKSEVAARTPAFRFAFSRPGFVTFKLPEESRPQDLFSRQWVFARTHGISLGNVSGTDLRALADEVWQMPQLGKRVVHDLHVWQPDADAPGQHGFEPGSTPLAAEIENALRQSAPADSERLRLEAVRPRRRTGRNRNVIDVVVVEPGEWWIGWHRVATPQHQWPGGVPPLALPPHTVSRAYLKLEEALRWSNFPLTERDEWVEIGCAPGGACQALLDRGQFVTGIDPAEVDEAVLAHERFRHLRMRGNEVRRREFQDVNWLAADLNVAPSYTLDTVEAIVTHPGTTIRGLVLTLKLPDWKLAERLPEFVERIRGWGYRDVRARQFAFSGREVGVVALRSRALRRLRRGRQRRRPVRVDQPHPTPPKPHF